MNCRICAAPLTRTFIDFGDQPLANAYLTHPDDPDPRYPLHARICENCLLVQADAVVSPVDLFSDYAFFSSYSQSWVDHARAYTRGVTDLLRLTSASQVIEIASNDGCLLASFNGPQVLGIEPAANIAAVAPVPTITRFFGATLAQELPYADLVVANNVLGHVPDLHDFTAGLAHLLKANGVLTIEVPHLLQLINRCEFDTIYHEHFAYFSFYALEQILGQHGLRVFDVESLAIHGGSLRLWVCRGDAEWVQSPAVRKLRRWEADGSYYDATESHYMGFASRVRRHVSDLVEFLGKTKADGLSVAGAGAPAKANTLLNAAGVTDEIAFVTDTSPHKQGKFLPGSHIPIYAPEMLASFRPDVVLVLAWNWLAEVMESLSFVREWGGRFAVAVPEMEML